VVADGREATYRVGSEKFVFYVSGKSILERLVHWEGKRTGHGRFNPKKRKASKKQNGNMYKTKNQTRKRVKTGARLKKDSPPNRTGNTQGDPWAPRGLKRCRTVPMPVGKKQG